MVKLDWHQTVDFVRKDWDKNPLRLTLETVNWLLNIVIAGTVSATVPHTDWSVVYPVIFVAIGISIY